MTENAMAKEEPNAAMLGARARYAAALQKMSELANSSVTNPALEPDYERAVQAVAAAEAALREVR
jgi:hypothetical protein